MPRRRWFDSCVDAGRALTALYGAGAEPGRLQWHARHKSERTTRRYVQELGASVVLARLPADRREAIVELTRTAPVLLRAVTAELRAPPRPSSPVTPRPAPAERFAAAAATKAALRRRVRDRFATRLSCLAVSERIPKVWGRWKLRGSACAAQQLSAWPSLSSVCGNPPHSRKAARVSPTDTTRRRASPLHRTERTSR